MNNTNSQIIECIRASCGQKLRVPIRKGILKLTCPVCKATWEWEPEDNLIDVITVRFQCSLDGREFDVYFAKKRNQTIYKICKIEKSNTGGHQSALHIIKTETRNDIHVAFADENNVSLDLLDFEDWKCLYCEYRQSDSDCTFDFVKCGKCQKYVCGKRSFIKKDGSAWFHCTPGCGSSGELNNNILTDLNGTHLEISENSEDYSRGSTTTMLVYSKDHCKAGESDSNNTKNIKKLN